MPNPTGAIHLVPQIFIVGGPYDKLPLSCFVWVGAPGESHRGSDTPFVLHTPWWKVIRPLYKALQGEIFC